MCVAGRMSDQNQPVRLMSTHCFATLIQLMPLDGGVPDPPNLTPELVEQKARERKFLEQLFNPKLIEDYKVPVPIQAELRSYQQVWWYCSCLEIKKTVGVLRSPYNLLCLCFSLVWTGWHSWTSTSFMASCVMTWDWERLYSPSASWQGIIIIGDSSMRYEVLPQKAVGFIHGHIWEVPGSGLNPETTYPC